MNLNFHRLNVINVSQVSTATSVIFSIPSWPVKSWDEHHGLRPCWLCPQQQEPQRWDFKAKKYWTQKQNSARMDPNGPHICATYADSYIPYILHSSTFAWPCLSLPLWTVMCFQKVHDQLWCHAFQMTGGSDLQRMPFSVTLLDQNSCWWQIPQMMQGAIAPIPVIEYIGHLIDQTGSFSMGLFVPVSYSESEVWKKELNYLVP